MSSKHTVISGNDKNIKEGDIVYIGGDLKYSKQIVNVVSEMREMLHSGITYPIREIKIKSKNGIKSYICKVDGWWFAPENLYKETLIKNPKMTNTSPCNFDINTLVT